MNLSMQIGRAMFALSLTAAGAYAIAQTDSDDAQAPAVAHSRLEIAPVEDAKEAPRWVVASVRVGTPVAQPRERASRVASNERAPRLPRS